MFLWWLQRLNDAPAAADARSDSDFRVQRDDYLYRGVCDPQLANDERDIGGDLARCW